MQLFYGECPICSFVWSVEGRIPNFCPECGVRLFNSHGEVMAAKGKFKNVQEVEE